MSNNGENSIYSVIQALSADTDTDLITLWGGTNDWASNIILGDFATQINPATRNTATFYGGLIANVEKLSTLYPKARLILIGTTPRIWNNGNSNYHKNANSNNNYLADFVEAVRVVAEYFGLPFLDLLHTSGINLITYPQYLYAQTDSTTGTSFYLHFSADGTAKIANRIAYFINSIG
jgi:lysophospholipase L1-like esterase